MLVAVGVTALVLVTRDVRRTGGRGSIGAGFAALAFGMLAGRLLNDWLIGASYGGRAIDEVQSVFAPLDDLDGILAVLRNLAGQSWYLLTATLGVVLLAAAAWAPGAPARIGRRRGDPADRLLVVLLATAAALLLVSALWLAGATRPDQLVYGRYSEPVVPVLVAVGLALLGHAERLPRVRPIVAGLAALTVLVAVLRAGLDLPAAASRWNVASLPSLTADIGAPVIALAGLVASGALSLLAAVARHAPAALAPLVLVLFVPTTAYITYLPVLRSERDVYPPGWTSPRAVVQERGAATVGYDVDRFDHIRVKTYQWFMPETRVVLLHGETDPAPATLFFSGATLEGRLARTGATAVWRDPGADQALWQRSR